MSEQNPYAPPDATLADISSVERRVPRVFLVLLAIYFLLEVIGTVSTGNYVWLARTAVIGVAAWRTIQGSRAASFFLGGMFALGMLLTLLSAVTTWGRSPADAIGELIAGVLFAVLAVHTFFSPSMRALYAENDHGRWRR